MHQYVLACHEEFNVIPSKDLLLWKRGVVLHDLLAFCPLFLIHKVGNQHVQGLFPVHKTAQGFKYFLKGLLIHPVIAVHHLKKDSGGIPKTGIHCLAMPPVLLMDCPADGRVSSRIFIRNLCCPVLGRAIIHNDDLHLLPARKQGIDTMFHITLRVIAGYCHG